ncbi:MAG: hypothetical protein JO149_02735 [Gammaproteobacteria bacterium]|nr:hypothetical protein [Gammaproteobacteria bacterium]
MFSKLNKTENRESIQKNQLEKIVGLRLFKRLELYTQRLIDANKHLLEDCDKAKNNINNFITEY